MKTIGLLGGMSWESTLNYYQAINQGMNNKMGGLHSAKIVMYRGTCKIKKSRGYL
jgi:aspartate racemase